MEVGLFRYIGTLWWEEWVVVGIGQGSSKEVWWGLFVCLQRQKFQFSYDNQTDSHIANGEIQISAINDS